MDDYYKQIDENEILEYHYFLLGLEAFQDGCPAKENMPESYYRGYNFERNREGGECEGS